MTPFFLGGLFKRDKIARLQLCRGRDMGAPPSPCPLPEVEGFPIPYDGLEGFIGLWNMK